MSRHPRRVHRRRIPAQLACALSVLAAGCTTYEADPVEPLEILRALDEVRLDGVNHDEVAAVVSALDVSDGLSLLEASAIAVRRNPSLTALRADLGVAEAQLMQAGLLSDPVIGWSAGDPIADTIIEGKVDSTSWLTGFSLSWALPRPGELDAEEGVAHAQIQGSAARLAGAEWQVVREVQLAYVRLLVGRARLAQNRRLLEISNRTRDFFTRARQAGAATALEEGLAKVAANTAQADLLGAQTQELQARQTLNGLLGLPPDHEWKLQDSLDRFVPTDRPEEDAQQLVRESLERRPDLQEVLAEYQRAEEQLRLECARQWPQIEIGTGLAIQIPIFSKFNQPAIETAQRRRRAARTQVTVAVQQLRGEIHAALTQQRQARAVLDLFRTSLGPQTEETLRLTERAFQAREITPLQILTAQRQVIETQGRFLVARQAWAEARIRLDSASGRLLPSARPPLPHKTTDEDSQ
jgi:outer membrane protein, heavy metal efflux system